MSAKNDRTIFGPYTLGELVGGGLCYEVRHLCRETSLDTERAVLKRIRRHVDSAEIYAAFKEEQELSQRFVHPHLARALDVGFVGEDPFIVLPYYGARCFDIESGSLSTLSQIASAVDAMHEGGVAHADITPQNILLSDLHVATLIDYSASSPLNQRQAATRGTYAYMSPEQVRGQILGPASDQFSLAVVAWEALAKRRLFLRGAPQNSMMAVVEDAAPLVSASREANEALGRALSKNPSQRFATCQKFIDALLRAHS